VDIIAYQWLLVHILLANIILLIVIVLVAIGGYFTGEYW
jgi:hypothetical protein